MIYGAWIDGAPLWKLALGLAGFITEEIIASGVLKTPGLMINGKPVSSDRIPAPATVAEWIHAAS